MIFVLILILLTAAIVMLERKTAPLAVMQAEYFSKRMANEVISRAVSSYLEENEYTYSDFAAVLYDENGKAVSVEALTYNINKVQSELMERINNAFSRSRYAEAEIPIGSLTGSYLMAGKGTEIRIRVCPVGEAEVELTSTFESSGLNQTCHRISAVVTADLESSLPLYDFSTETSFEFLVAENVIVGDIGENHYIVGSQTKSYKNE